MRAHGAFLGSMLRPGHACKMVQQMHEQCTCLVAANACAARLLYNMSTFVVIMTMCAGAHRHYKICLTLCRRWTAIFS